MEETDKYFRAADAGSRPKSGSGGREDAGGVGALTGSGVMVNKDSPIFTMKQEMDVLNLTLQLFISAL